MYKKCYCAFCKNPRKVYVKKHVHFSDFVYCSLLSVLLGFVIWQSFDAKSLVLLVLFLMLSEVFILLRSRMSMPCSYCGFDPILYKRDPKLMVELVKQFMDKRKSNPKYIFSSYKLDKIAKVKKKATKTSVSNAAETASKTDLRDVFAPSPVPVSKEKTLKI